MTVLELRRQVNLIVEPITGGATVPSPIVFRYLNKGTRLLNNAALFNIVPLSLSTTSGVRHVALPSDFLAMAHVIYNNSRVSNVPYEMINTENTATGVPVRYALVGSNIYFDPIPNTTGATVSGFYYADVQDLANITDSPSFPTAFHDFLVDYVVAEYLMSIGKPDAAMVYRRRFDEGLRMLTAHYDKGRAREDIKVIRAHAREWGKIPAAPQQQ